MFLNFQRKNENWFEKVRSKIADLEKGLKELHHDILTYLFEGLNYS